MMTPDTLLSAWAERAGLHLPITGDVVVHGWANMEIGYEIDRDGAEFAFAKSDRGSARPLAWFAGQADADRMLLLQLGLDWRSANGIRRTTPARLADGAALDGQEGAWALTWAGGTARFRQQISARLYSGVATLPLDELSKRLLDPTATF